MYHSKQAEASIDFLVVGGGIAGLACACALRRVGHRVTVLERSDELVQISGGSRIPPNLSKILFNWGLEEEVRRVTVKSGAVHLLVQPTGELLGAHVWDEEVLKETRGEYLFTRHEHLQKLLYDTALKLGAKIRMRAEVTAIDSQAGTVTLKSGEVLTARVVVGADGLSGLSRKILASKQPGSSSDSESKSSKPSLTMSMYSAVIPGSAIVNDPDLATLCNQEHTTLVTWMGDSRCALGFPISPGHDFALLVCSSLDSEHDSWEDYSVPPEKLQKALAPCEPKLEKLGKLAMNTTCVKVANHPELEDWVDGRLVIIGDAAHPFVAGSIQPGAMAVEDGAVLAKLFSHLRSEDQISSFLWAFQDLRQPRCRFVTESEVNNIKFMTAPPSDFQEQRDQELKRKRDAGIDVLESFNEEQETPEWTHIKKIFGYDAEDEADNWWVQWGLLRERERGTVKMDLTGIVRDVHVVMDSE